MGNYDYCGKCSVVPLVSGADDIRADRPTGSLFIHHHPLVCQVVETPRAPLIVWDPQSPPTLTLHDAAAARSACIIPTTRYPTHLCREKIPYPRDADELFSRLVRSS